MRFNAKVIFKNQRDMLAEHYKYRHLKVLKFMDLMLSTTHCEEQLNIDKLKAALLASEVVNHALIRIIDGYVSREGYESREKMLLPIRRKLRLILNQPLKDRFSHTSNFDCDDATFEAAIKLAVVSAERAIGL